jgi:hypothetical protein
VKAHDQYKDKAKVLFLGATGETAKASKKTRSWLTKNKVGWPVLMDADKLARGYKILGFPTTYVIGPRGTVLWHDELPGTIEGAIAAALKAGG